MTKLVFRMVPTLLSGVLTLTLLSFLQVSAVKRESLLHPLRPVSLLEVGQEEFSAVSEYGNLLAGTISEGSLLQTDTPPSPTGGAAKKETVNKTRAVKKDVNDTVTDPWASYNVHNRYNPYSPLNNKLHPAPKKHAVSIHKNAPAATNTSTAKSAAATTEICPSHCSGNGYCASGNCYCKQGFTGQDCAQPTCPNDCNNNGHCVLGQCHCFAGWNGFDCSYRGCQDQCNHQGYCHVGADRSSCICFPGFSGTTCAVGPACGWGENGKSCSGNGACHNKKCYCNQGYTGDDCSQKICPSGSEVKTMCSGFGVCNTHTGSCECEYPHFGVACENAKCPGDCTGNGECDRYGQCKCKKGFYGKDCSPKNCPDDCNGKGQCHFKVHTLGEAATAQCECDKGYGPAKGKPNSCSERICEPGYIGKNCEQRVCLDNCHADQGHGQCDRSTFTCSCKDGWSGVSCQFKTCPDLCNHHGTCNDGVCSCKDDWTGVSCAIPPKKCPNSCSSHGFCFQGECYCDDGWTGKDCHKPSLTANDKGEKPITPRTGIVCIPACSDNGQCMTTRRNGQQTNECFCKDGWSGLSCDTYVHTPGNYRSLDHGASIGPAFLEQGPSQVRARLSRKAGKQSTL